MLDDLAALVDADPRWPLHAHPTLYLGGRELWLVRRRQRERRRRDDAVRLVRETLATDLPDALAAITRGGAT
jgi:hypothetical protein